MGTLYLVRHGQASFGADNYDQLSDLGHRQSVRLGEYFAERGMRFDALMTGTLLRHRQTLAGILEGLRHSGEHVAWEGLDEYDSGALIATVKTAAGPVPDDARERHRQHFRMLRDGLSQWMAGQAQPDGMVSYEHFVAGVRGALDHVRAHHHGQQVLMVSSGGPIATAVGHVLGASPSAVIELNLRLRNTSISEFVFTPKRHALLSLNGVPHLDNAAHQDWITYV